MSNRPDANGGKFIRHQKRAEDAQSFGLAQRQDESAHKPGAFCDREADFKSIHIEKTSIRNFAGLRPTRPEKLLAKGTVHNSKKVIRGEKKYHALQGANLAILRERASGERTAGVRRGGKNGNCPHPIKKE